MNEQTKTKILEAIENCHYGVIEVKRRAKKVIGVVRHEDLDIRDS